MKQNLSLFLKRNSSTILTVMGAIGVVVTGVEIRKATLKADKVIAEAEENKKEELTTKEVILKTVPIYIPSVILGVSTITCIFSVNALNKRQQVAITSAYALIDRTYKDYRTKVKELFGEEADNKIQNAIILDKRDEDAITYALGCNPLPTTKGEIITFYETYRDGYFEATIETVLNAEYHLNRNLALRGFVSLNEFYDFLGLSPIEQGDVLGWDINRLIEGYDTSWIDFDHRLIVLDDGFECYHIEMPIGPVVEDDI